MSYMEKYLKYKSKYIELKSKSNMIGGYRHWFASNPEFNNNMPDGSIQRVVIYIMSDDQNDDRD